jgi:4-hydroxy-3-methylbut-2-enyl diphosphate reductase
MLVIGGKNSANTKRLFDICRERVKTYWISEISEMDAGWFGKSDTVGITAGASTPQSQIAEAIRALEGKLYK